MKLLEGLRLATRTSHDELERLTGSQRLMEGLLSPLEYLELIRWQHQSHQILEPALLNFEWEAPYRYRSRLPALAADLQKLELEFLAPPENGSMSLAPAVGRAYVLEGGSLGATVILKHLEETEQLSNLRPFNFYGWQRTEGLKQWRNFLAFAENHGWSSEEREEAEAAALEAFTVFQTCWEARSLIEKP